jgi:nitrite reductase/ring-hydroxylating ferredoxin subunit
MSEILVCQPGDLADGEVRIVRAGETEIGVIRKGDEWFAYRNLCPHQGGPACEGVRMFGVMEKVAAGGVTLGHYFDEEDLHIVCPWHGYEFHLSDGKHVRDPRVRLQKFAVAERDDGVYVTI